jgi:zinc transport system substrate-binding protein
MRFLLFSFLLLSFCHGHAEDKPPVVLVSLAPYRTFVKKIAQDLVQVEVMVPPGASAHTYEPTPKQMELASKADIWFFLGEPFEKKALQAVQHAKPSLQAIHLTQGIPLLKESCHCSSCGEDLHIWLSPSLAKIQAKTIADALSELYPEHAAHFRFHLTEFVSELDALDHFIRATLSPVQQRILMVSHPAYAYFCRDYGLTQLSVENEGRDPTQKQMTALLEQARKFKIRFILAQPQYSDKAAKLVASQIGAKVISVDPYSEDYENALRRIATLIAENAS